MPDLAARSGLAVDARGQVLVDTYLRRITDDRIFAIGAAVPGARFSCQGATPQGSHAATNVARLLTGRAPKPYSMGYLALCVGLGRRDAVLQVNHRDDSPRRVYVAGRSGAVSKAALTRSAKYVARTGPTGFWMKGPRSRMGAPDDA